jgi:DNA-binding MarR family transcriptional regulator
MHVTESQFAMTEVVSTEPTSPACINLQMLRASHYIMKAYDEAYRPLGVRATQMPVLGVVARRGPVTIKQVADEMESERSAISRKLQVMEQNGWITEDPETTGKEKAFVLTAEGRKVIDRILPVRLQVQQRLMGMLSNEEQKLLMSLCTKLKGAADEVMIDD